MSQDLIREVLDSREFNEAVRRIIDEALESLSGDGITPTQKLTRKTTIPDNWSPSPATVDWARKHGYLHDLPDHVEFFVGACRAKGYKYCSFDQALMNAIRNNWARIAPPGDTNDALAAYRQGRA